MLDINFIRDNEEFIAMAAKKKHLSFDVRRLIRVDDERREALKVVEEMRAKQNQTNDAISGQIAPAERLHLIDEMKALKESLQTEEEKLKKIMARWQKQMLQVPNIPDISVPEGESDADNVEYSSWGERPEFDFPIKDHIELMEALDMVDLERGTKVAGFRGYYLKNDGACLHFAIARFVEDEFLKKNDFTPMVVPSLLRPELLFGTGYLPQGKDDLYKTQDGLYLSGTAEVATMGYYMGEVLKKEDLPIKFFSLSPSFRREAGSHGKDTKGLYRVHEFVKYEQVILCEANHEKSVKYHEELRQNSEDLLQKLGLHYRVVVNCGGDLGLGQVKKYDIEAWTPSKDGYGETHSASYFHDFQSRRLNIRYTDEEGKKRFVHSLNNTAIALPRLLIMIIESYQQADGTIKVPEVLVPYVGKEILGKKNE